ncbi:hypothetical protein ACFYMO_03695 [Streptomyces sp. NPDC007025]|uniref:hypothetical protein n=1 Tax=Streptomyces sp. NPDC007025 TaxID=3364771 RepID=UPI0036B802C0
MARYAHRPLTAARTYSNAFRLTTPPAEPTDETTGVDWIAVERAARDDYDPRLLTDDERREAALLLGRAGYGIKPTSTRLCIYERLICEWFADAGLLPPERICTADGCNRAKVGLGLCIGHLQAKRAAEKQAKKAAEEAAAKAAAEAQLLVEAA